jgi:hypothetical protein
MAHGKHARRLCATNNVWRYHWPVKPTALLLLPPQPDIAVCLLQNHELAPQLLLLLLPCWRSDISLPLADETCNRDQETMCLVCACADVLVKNNLRLPLTNDSCCCHLTRGRALAYQLTSWQPLIADYKPTLSALTTTPSPESRYSRVSAGHSRAAWRACCLLGQLTDGADGVRVRLQPAAAAAAAVEGFQG